MKSYDIAVIGLGAMGCAAAWRLSNAGFSVVGFDQFTTPNTNGSSHGRTRVIRQSYYENPNYVPLLKKSYQLWDELQASTGQPVIDLCGGVYFGPERSELVQGSLTSAQKFHLKHEFLKVNELKSRFPQFQFLRGDVGLYEKQAGFVFVEESLLAMKSFAVSCGATFHEEEKVLKVNWDKNPIQIITDKREVFVKKVCVCAGPWAASFFPEFGKLLNVTRQTVGWFQPDHPKEFESSLMPIFACEREGKFYYGVPITGLPGESGFKIACHDLGNQINPDFPISPVTDVEMADLTTIVQELFPSSGANFLRAENCKYTNSPDGHFIIDYLPENRNVIFAAGMSGHGFKFAPVIGDILTSFAKEEPYPLEISFLSLNRF